MRTYQRVEPLLVARYDPGVELVVKSVRVEQNRIKIDLVQLTSPDGSEDSVTSITVKWPAPISKSLSERVLIENTMRGFVDLKPAPWRGPPRPALPSPLRSRRRAPRSARQPR